PPPESFLGGLSRLFHLLQLVPDLSLCVLHRLRSGFIDLGQCPAVGRGRPLGDPLGVALLALERIGGHLVLDQRLSQGLEAELLLGKHLDNDLDRTEQGLRAGPWLKRSAFERTDGWPLLASPPRAREQEQDRHAGNGCWDSRALRDLHVLTPRPPQVPPPAR